MPSDAEEPATIIFPPTRTAEFMVGSNVVKERLEEMKAQNTVSSNGSLRGGVQKDFAVNIAKARLDVMKSRAKVGRRAPNV